MAIRVKKPIPFAFALDALARFSPYTKPMFGCTAVYVGEKIVLALREREDFASENGVWLATSKDHHASLRAEFPGLRSINVLSNKRGGETGWQVLSADLPDFESAVLRICALIGRKDPRIGKVPKRKKTL